ncbi:hypothetical protein NL676_035943 [Syzygium grande]|nr:hypothetical protein NL676_035943 [Syzygium grande]
MERDLIVDGRDLMEMIGVKGTGDRKARCAGFGGVGKWRERDAVMLPLCTGEADEAHVVSVRTRERLTPPASQ